MASHCWSWALLLLASAVRYSAGAPSISFPINSQVPPAARIGQPFSFNFSPSTFSSDSPISYSLANPPEWLSIDSGARRLYGTPGEGDIGPGQVVGVPIELIATDATGSTTMSSTLVVSRNPSPVVNIPLTSQIPQFGIFSGPSSILCHPDKPFALDLADDTFTNPSKGSLNYYAVTEDNTPLPAWVSFDPSKLSFAGTTPPLATLIQPPQSFGFRLLASDITGFSAAVLPFTIVVGSHEITADQTSVALNATAGSPLTYSGLQGLVKVDGRPATAGDSVVAALDNAPKWLSLDKDSWNISGTPPATANSTEFIIVLQDSFSDKLNITVSVDVTGGSSESDAAFKGSLPELNIIPGHHFSVDLGPYLASSRDVDVSISTSPPLDWIQFSAGHNTISGDAPASLGDLIIAVTIQVKPRGSGKPESQVLSLHIQANNPSASSSQLATASGVLSRTSGLTSGMTSGVMSAASTSTPPLATDTSSSNASASGDSPASEPSHVTLVAILVPLLILASVLLTMLMCYLRRRRQSRASKPKRSDISGPLPGSFVMNAAGADETGQLYDIRKQYDVETPPRARIKPEQGVYFEAGSRNQSESSIPPMPDMAKITALKNRIRSGTESRLNGSRTSWFAAAAVGVLKPGKQARKSKSRSYLSDTSLYPDPSDGTDKNSLSLLGNGSRTSFRDALEVNIPEIITPSIQHTPDIAYSGQEVSGYWRSGSRAASDEGRDGSSGARRVEPLGERPASRRTQQGQTSPTDKAWAPWPKGGTGDLAKTIKKQASLLSMATVDTFAHKKRPTTSGSPGQDGSDDDMIHIPRTRSIRPVNEPEALRTLSRKDPNSCRWFGGNLTEKRGPVRKSAEAEGEPPTAAVDMSGFPGRPVMPPGVPEEHVPRDSLGISYSELIDASPFHPSKSWSTIHSAGDETQAQRGAGVEVKALNIDYSGTKPSAQPNWTVLNESPIIKDWRGVDSGKSDLISPSRWPQAQTRERSRETPSPSPPLGARAAWAGTALSKSRRSQAARGGQAEGGTRDIDDGTRSTGSRDREDYAVYI